MLRVACKQCQPVMIARADNDKPGVQNIGFSVIRQWLTVKLEDFSARLFDDALGCGSVPLRGRAKARVDVSAPFGDDTEFQ